MLAGIWGRKIGMTQLFQNNVATPVTVVDLSRWIVVGIKTKERDGYSAIVVGNVKNRYQGMQFSSDWLKNLRTYFSLVREITMQADAEGGFQVGQALDPVQVFTEGSPVDVSGITKGKGFQGVVKRHGFSGGKATHGPRFGRWPGSIGFMRRQGRVVKGKKLPGHMGTKNRTAKRLSLLKVDQEQGVALIQGSVPGHAGAYVYIKHAK